MQVKLSLAVRFLCVAWLVPFILSAIVYYGFSTNYTGDVFSEAGFRNQYERDIYKYRILGRSLQLKINELIEQYDFPTLAPRSLMNFDVKGTPQFYTAYFINNTIFLCLSCSVFFKLLNKIFPQHSSYIADFILLLLCFFMTITQYAVVPYDTLSYLFFASAIYLVLSNHSSFNSILLCCIVVLATLTRETAVLIISFYFVIHVDKLIYIRAINRNLIVFFVMVLCFIITYLLLRLILGTESAFFHLVRLHANLTDPFSIIGIVFLCAIVLIMLADSHNRHRCVLFLLAASPYILPIVWIANPWEIRLWVPVIIGLVILKVLPPNLRLQGT